MFRNFQPTVGFEPTAVALQIRCSTPELSRHYAKYTTCFYQKMQYLSVLLRKELLIFLKKMYILLFIGVFHIFLFPFWGRFNYNISILLLSIGREISIIKEYSISQNLGWRFRKKFFTLEAPSYGGYSHSIFVLLSLFSLVRLGKAGKNLRKGQV